MMVVGCISGCISVPGWLLWDNLVPSGVLQDNPFCSRTSRLLLLRSYAGSKLVFNFPIACTMTNSHPWLCAQEWILSWVSTLSTLKKWPMDDNVSQLNCSRRAKFKPESHWDSSYRSFQDILGNSIIKVILKYWRHHPSRRKVWPKGWD